MGNFKAQKVVSVLPSILSPDTIYLVRVESGFDLYCADTTGTIAHKINPAANTLQLNYPLGYRLDNALNATAPGTYSNATLSNLVLYPFPLSRKLRLSTLEVSVTTAAASGSCIVGIYDSNLDGTPKDLLMYSSSLSFSSVGTRTQLTGFIRTQPNTYVLGNLNTLILDPFSAFYWMGYFTDGAGGVIRGVPLGSLTSLGYISSGGNAIVTQFNKVQAGGLPNSNPLSSGGFTPVSGTTPSVRFSSATI